ncbi:MAG: hypothetical protein NZM12_02315 [Steroidobacteraceae bacterium]|nr:hypothetical protein [Steroidobacteraceae bacterium]MDW8259803.1 hypothetical protein [Gammaproteobacteria bacterium]
MNELRPQFINLYRRPTGWIVRALRLDSVLVALGLLTVGLVALSFYGASRVQRLEVLTAAIVRDIESRSAALSATGATYRTRADYRALQQRVAGLRQLIARQDVVLGRMSLEGLGSRRGFAEQLAAIGRVRIAGVWLTQVEMSAVPERLRLGGIAMQPTLLPHYLTALGSEPGLGLRRLHSVTVDQQVGDQRAAAAGAVAFHVLQGEDPQGAMR